MKLVDGNSLKKFYNLIKRVFVTQKEFTEKLDGKANNIHTHDNRYYTESEVDNKLSTKSPIGHTHSANDVGAKESDWLPDWEDIQNVPYAFDPKLGTTSTTAFRGDRGNLAYQHSLEEHAPSDAQKNSDITKSEIEAKLTGIIASHNHNGQYYTEAEVDGMMINKADVNHRHTPEELGAISPDWNSITNKPKTFPPTLGNTEVTAFRGDYGEIAYSHSQEEHAPIHAQKNSDITKAEIEAKLTGDIKTHDHNTNYFTKSEIESQMTDKSDITHNHDGMYIDDVTLTKRLLSKADTTHSHTAEDIGALSVDYTPTWDLIEEKPSTFPPNLGINSTSAFRGDHGNTAYQHSQSEHAPTDAQKNSDITKEEIEEKLVGEISSHNHNGQYFTEAEVKKLLETKAELEHLHEDYITLAAMNNALAGKANVKHAHTIDEIGGELVVSTNWDDIIGKPATFAPTLGTSNTTAFRGDYGNTAYQHAQSDHAPASAQKNSDITKGEIEAKLTGSITSHNHNGQYYSRADIDTQMANKAETNHNHNYVPLATYGNITIHADNDASSSSEFAMLKAGHNELKVTSSGGGKTETRGQDKLTFNGHVVYHAGKKPTAIDVGARPSSWIPSWAEIDNKPPTFTPTLGTTATSAFRGDYGNAAYIHSQSAHAPSTAQKNSDITKGEIEARLTGTITSHNHNGQYYTEAEVDGFLSGKANVAHGVHVPAPQSPDNAKFLRNDNKWETVTPRNIKAVAGDYKSATTPATSRWYIIAETESVDQSNTIGTFIIRSAVSGKHSSTILNAGITYGSNPILQQISHTAYTVSSITKARIAYHTTYSGHRAYLEVFVPDNTAREIDVQLIGNSGWRLVSPDTIGGLLAGYISYEKTLVVGKIVSDINGKVNGCNLTYENGDFYLSND